MLPGVAAAVTANRNHIVCGIAGFATGSSCNRAASKCAADYIHVILGSIPKSRGSSMRTVDASSIYSNPIFPDMPSALKPPVAVVTLSESVLMRIVFPVASPTATLPP